MSNYLVHGYPVEAVVARRRTRGSGGGAAGSDAFNRANDATGLGTADTGQVWTNRIGIMGILSNRAYAEAETASDSLATADFGLADGTFKVTIAVVPDAADYSGLAIRFLNATNYIRLAAGGSGDATMYIQKVEGTASTLGSAPHGGLTNGDTVSLVASGSALSARKNDIEVTSGSSSFQATLTEAGPYMNGAVLAAGRLDNWLVTA